jgi:two-component system, NarL family, response regulator LiaR
MNERIVKSHGQLLLNDVGGFSCNSSPRDHLTDDVFPRASTRIKVAMVDDDEGVRRTLDRIIDASDGFQRVGSYRSAGEALRHAPEVNPEIAFVDLRLPDMSGFECMHRLKAAVRPLTVIVLSAATDPATVEKSLAAGAVGFLAKPFSPEQCFAILRFSAHCKHPLPSADLMLDGVLTPRERDVLKALAEGLLYKEIAHKLHISFSAVHKHQHNIFIKLGVTNRTEAVRKWVSHRAVGAV